MKYTYINEKKVPVIGMGTWALGVKPEQRQDELKALYAGFRHGMALVDTAEMYGEGLTEELTGEFIKSAGKENLYIVSKIYPHNANKKNLKKSCENSLKRMGIDCMDLYLLHWRGAADLSEAVYLMEQLKREGKIREWGVSNFDTADMKELWKIPDGDKCRVNQVLYHIASRGIEFELQPWLDAHNVTVMAYCPLAQGGELSRGLLNRAELKEIAHRHNATPAQILIAFTVRNGRVISIPRSGSFAHTVENAKAAEIVLTSEDMEFLDYAFPPPERKMPLDVE